MIPPKANAAFVANMEEVLAVYTRPYDEKRPVVCLDEGGKQLSGDTRPPLPVRAGSPAEEDYEYTRNGTAHIFLTFEPLRGVRHATVTERRTNRDFAREVRELLDVRYPAAEKVVPVLDNLSTHTPAALYEAFAPAEARRQADRQAELARLAERERLERDPQWQIDQLRRQVAELRAPQT